ncbi:aldose epimerase [Bacillus salipaludis]|uniref:aldose epimerase family protein n=1 Tax=Bacillus salipaludis TaxID=2547811 RepID=UPI002E1A4A12|nr:aldose epimerase [Bacillus salipaludis]
MYQIKKFKDKNYDIYELNDVEANSWLKVAPERGGMIIEFGVQGKELLFLNKETFYQSDANVRGGIPILFPISGQLENGEYEWEGKTYKMKNHGLARNYAWEVVDTRNNNEASITVSLKSNEEMKKSFPFEFEVNFTYVLKKHTLKIVQEYKNQSDMKMPMYPGFHPYFRTAHKNMTYETDAKTFLDYNDMKIKEVSQGLDLMVKRESLVLLDAIKKEISFELPEIKKKVQITYGDEFKYVYLWTESGQDFLCVEPWMAMTNELNRKEELVFVSPRESLITEMTISAE